MGFVRIAVFSRLVPHYSLRLFVLLCIIALSTTYGPLVPRMSAQMPTPVTVPTWRYDLTHSGANTSETILTPANVNGAAFGKLFSQTVDGSVYAQPLYLPGLTMGDGLVHNVLFVATEHDSVYAFDADTNGGANQNPLWKVTLLDAAHGAASGATTVPYTDVNCPDIAPEIGITATPVIDPSTNTMYVVGKSKESGTYVQRLHALDIFTGAEKTGSPVVIQAAVPGTGTGSSGGQLAFNALRENNRTALNLYNGHVYIGFGSHGDISPFHGWLFAYDATTLAQTAVLCLSPDGSGNSIWATGAGMPIDTTVAGGRMFLVTGNGTYSNIPPFNPTSDYGDSIVAIDLSNGQLTPTDIFTPFNEAHLASDDLDEGSAGILIFPDQPGAYPHILLQAGKEGRIIVLDRDNLGGYAAGATSNTNALQDIPGQIQGLWSTPAYWNGNVYFWGSGDLHTPGGTPTMFQLNNGVLGTTPSSVSPILSKHPGGIFSVSSNGTSGGIAWAIRTDGFGAHTDAILYAWDATNLSNLLYESDANSTRDSPGTANKFAVPVVTNGKVYVAAVQRITVYGLLDNNPIAAAPAISPNGGYFPNTQTVTLSSATPSANIYYTLDGTVPTQASTLYTGPISIGSNTTVQAIAAGSGLIASPVTRATFTITPATPAVAFNPPGGIYSSTQTIALSETDPNAVVYYTADGSTPTTSSTMYAGPLSIATTATIKAIAVDPNLQPSPVATAIYTMQAGAPTINFASGFASVAGLKLNGSAAQSNSLLQLTSGKLYQAASAYWNQPIGIQAFTSDFTFQLLSAQTDGITFTIQNAGVTALGPNGPGIGYGAVKPSGTPGIGRSVAIKFDIYNNFGEGSDSTGVYTDGVSPTIPAIDMTSSGVLLRSGDTMQAHITYDGTTLTMKLTDTVNSKTFTFSQPMNIPQIVGSNTAFVGFTASTGSLTAIQNILTWTYTTVAASPTTATPAFSPPGGSYATAQSVSLSDSTSGASIYYTTDGTAPTTASTVYSSPIAAGTGTTTIQAMAIAPGDSQSATAIATYAIGSTIAAPTFSPPAGSYTTTQNVTLADSTSGAIIYYTTNGSTPTAASTVYSAPIAVAASETIRAIAVVNSQASAAASAAYTIGASPTINFSGGFPSATGLSLNSAAKVANNILQMTLSPALETKGSAWFTTPVSIASFTTDFNFQLLSVKADGFTFTLQNSGLSALGPVGSGLGYGASKPGGTGGIAKSVAIKFDIYSNDGEGSDSTGVYTNGVSPTIPASDMTASGVKLNSGHLLHAHITYDGTNLTMLLTDTVTSASYTLTTAIDIPSVIGSGTAYAGFTGGTGGLSMTTNILNWTLTPGTP